ncbi:ATP-grasp domain-containing protein [Aestuariibacter salexigens]|uniref:arsenate reductase/protein-tyrosine-phosphatase family protein n=1 Tax=Aestuariibacter salexigens TaxID=226010 RepID=UPI00042667D2|nr:ATP-grasp domain-containing protein [Aestuariibacter salexigens]
MSTRKRKALVIGEDTRSFLSVIRSLGKMGLDIHVICYDRTSPALESVYIKQAWYFNYQAYTQLQWIEKVIEVTCAEHYDLVIPCDERAIFPLIENQEAFPEETKLALPNMEVLENLFDKFSTKKVALECNVPVAKGELVKIKQVSFEELDREFGLPFVIKPVESFNSNKLSKRNKVEIIRDKSAFERVIIHISEDEEFLIEEFFTGIGEGVSVFATKGKIQYIFAHKRVNEPRSGGGSSYRKAIAVDPSMAEACEKMCNATSFDGVGMFEFRRNPETHKWILVEVNARFWGSLPLAVHAGIDFPRCYAEYLLGEFNDLPDPVSSYNKKALARSLTNDLYDMRAEMQAIAVERNSLVSYAYVTKRLLSLLNVFLNEKVDSYDRDDKAPFKEEYKQFLDSAILSKLKTRFRSDGHGEELVRSLMRTLYECEGKGRIVFVCYGNIMRSPFAEKVCNTLINNMGLPFTCHSYGCHQNENRQSPEECLIGAENLGINLFEHRSKWLKQTDLNPCDIVFVFDEYNLDTMRRFYDVPYLFNLADFIPQGLGRHSAISDPYGKGQEAVDHCYLLITEAIKHIIETYVQWLYIPTEQADKQIEQLKTLENL